MLRLLQVQINGHQIFKGMSCVSISSHLPLRSVQVQLSYVVFMYFYILFFSETSMLRLLEEEPAQIAIRTTTVRHVNSCVI